MIIENELYAVEVEDKHGLIVQVTDRSRKLKLIDEPRLTENFRLLVPLPHCEANYILGKEQKLSRIEKTPAGAVLHWDGPLTSPQGQFNLAVKMTIELVGQEIRFGLEVRNNTEHKLAEAWYPMLGGMMGLGKGAVRKSTKVFIPTLWVSNWFHEIFKDFGHPGDLGDFGPEHLAMYPGSMAMAWVSMFNPELGCGLYIGTHEKAARLRAFRQTMSPGLSCRRVGGDWPDAKELRGLPAGVTANWTHFPYTPPGQTFVGSTIVLRFHDGDWRQSAAIYREWFTSQFAIADSRKNWIRQETAVQDAMFMLPEGNLNFKFTDIPAWAKAARDRGLKAVLISGWQVGGHDRGYPQYEPDPRIGTYEELRAGIAKCHEMGMKVYFFVNVSEVDISTEWYKQEGHKYMVTDPLGCLAYIRGFGMGTIGARMGSTRAPCSEASPGVPQYRALLTNYWKKLAEVGADGVHIDKLFPVPLNFNPLAEGSPDSAEWEGHLKFLDEMMAACRAINPDFQMSYEGWWDRLLAYSDVCWWAPDGHAAMKVTFPTWAPTVGVSQPYDFNVVNLAVVRAQNLLVGPAHYNRSMDYPPMKELGEYIGEVTRIRGELLDYVSRGELVDASEATFRSPTPLARVTGAAAKDPNVHWAVYRNTQNGKRAIVVANLGRKPVKGLKLTLADGDKAGFKVYRPFKKVANATSKVTLDIPAERIAILVEL